MCAATREPTALERLTRGCHPGWLALFREAKLDEMLDAILAKVCAPGAPEISPPPDLVFEAFRYGGPDDALGVIVGQDPYPTDAQGICFSIPHATKIKGSLGPIIGNLERNGLAVRHQNDGAAARTGDLAIWALQGVFMINTALTTELKARGSHVKLWEPFTRGLIAALSERAATRGRALFFMLWGNPARALSKWIRHGDEPHRVLEWTHPSPLSNNRLEDAAKFEAAPHFADANAALDGDGSRPINWDPLGRTYVFTDGSCIGNGKPDAHASYAALVLKGPLAGVAVSGPVARREYRFVDDSRPELGFEPDPDRDALVPATNNRGEYLAGCWALLLQVRARARGRTEIVSDSKLFVSTMTEWLPNRKKRGTETELKNYDLIRIADRLLEVVRDQSVLGDPVTFTHVNSHRACPPQTAPARDRALWYGNDRADRLAGQVTEERPDPDSSPRLLHTRGSLAADRVTATPLEEANGALAWRLAGRFE